MKFETNISWDAPLARVLAMVTSIDYVQRRLARMNYEQFEVLESSDDGELFTIVSRIIGKPTVQLPALAQKFIKPGQTVEIVQTDSWNRATASGTLVLDNKSISVVTVSATMQLSEADGITTNVVSWDVNCGVPLVGGKLASMIADDIRAKAAQNQEVSREILAAHF